jgi:hypothetical protein
MRKVTVLLAAILVVVLSTTVAFGWGFGTHAYIASEIGKRGGDPNLMEVYGATLPDMFNYAFEAGCDTDALFDMTHVDENYLAVYDSKNRGLEKWVAAGLVMHNQEFGIDHTAHVLSAVGSWTGGYVNVKADAMDTALMEAWIASPSGAMIYPLQVAMVGMGIEPDPETVHSLYHVIIEYSADLLLKQAVPDVGPTLYAAATFYPAKQYPLVMVDAFVDDVSEICGISAGDAAAFLTSTEMAHRQVVTYEAELLSITNSMEALLLTADHLATVGMGFLGIPYVPTDPYSQAMHDQFAQLGAGYIQIAMGYFLDDYFEEAAATVDLVEQNMVDYGIIKK